ncbi:hypothetical protein D0Z07_0643 [Hyphodiscus hymeniophilus]|uniref:Uncharacterized protein n=1 Tax=Hyphodiscus hymeniophilus TaxID=353542 RepID=A0A9P6VQK9_9HELO|nr:hypothetical protein D0Z07_0643 [Hyphodiscus hymeniophilus]
MTFNKPLKPHLMAYHIGRGEQGVLTYEPYKSYLLPLWRFRTVPIARTSSEALWSKFLEFYDDEDFVGMDMTRKFIRMGMTEGDLIEGSEAHKGKEEKEEASRIFRKVWERCKGHEGYANLKKRFLDEQREWQSEHVKIEEEQVEDAKSRTRKSTAEVKVEND